MKRQSGQALVLVLLSLAVVLTLVLFILARSVTDVAVSSREEEAVRAFSAAEAGVEKALIIGTNLSSTSIGDASYSANVSEFASGSTSFVYPISIASGDSVPIWFASQDSSASFSGSTLKICWGTPGASEAPAIEVSIIYSPSANSYQVARAAFDPDAARAISNSFDSSVTSGACSVNGQAFAYQKTIDLSSLGVSGTLEFGKVRMFYNTTVPQKVAFDSTTSDTFPTQGTNIDSSGSAGQSNRRIEVFQGWAEAPTVFDYSIYSSTGLTK